MKSKDKLTCHFLTEEEKWQVSDWKYSGEYEIYNLPPCEVQKQQQTGFFTPGWEKNYYSFYDGDRFIAYINMREEKEGVMLGISVNPAYCNRGYGQRVLEDACIISQKRCPDKCVYLIVRTWNQRAIACYRKAGFVMDGKPFEMVTGSGPGIFVKMVKW